MNLTKRAVDALRVEDRDRIYWDRALAGFGLRVWPSGRRVYVLQYRVGGGRGGRVRRMTLGAHGAITPDQARELARDHLHEVARGGDPVERRNLRREAPTMAAFADRYLDEHARPRKKARSVSDDLDLLRLLILPALGRLKVRDISTADVARLMHANRHRPVRANRARALLSKMCNLARAWGVREAENPCRHVAVFPERGRERFLSDAEFERLGAVLARLGRDAAEPWAALAAIRLLLLTGCRKSEVLGLRWDWIDLDAGMIRLPDSKTGRKTVYLSVAAVELIGAQPRIAGNPHVFASPRKAGAPFEGLTHVWARVRVAAGLPDVRLHDLRHSFASKGVAAGLSLPEIGKLLGHSQPGTTARYAHLAADPHRLATERVAGSIAAALLGPPARR